MSVALSADGLVLSGEDGRRLATWKYAAITRLFDEAGAEPVRLACGDARLTVAASGFAAELARAAPRLRSHSLGIRLARAAAAVLLAAAAGAALWWGLPHLDGPLAAIIPDSWEERLGEQVMDSMPGRRCTEAGGVAALARLVDRLTAGVELPHRLSVEVADRPDVNAFAAPGGRIVLFRGLLQEAESPDEVAGVLAHEITHSRRRHPTRNLIRFEGTSLLADLAFGGGSGDAVTAMGRVLVQLAYNREFEREADAGAVELLQNSDIDTAGLASFFDRIVRKARGSAMPAILVTHPPPDERSAMVRAHPVLTPRPALSDDDWQKLRAICNPAR